MCAKIHTEIFMAKKVDGVITAARFENGQIVAVRAYERRGATYSDHVFLDRNGLLERLKSGKRFLVGERKELLASTFELGKPVEVVSHNGKEIIATRRDAERDELEQAPVF
jgi:hypothetical protein